MAEEMVKEKSFRYNKEDAIDRLSHCADKAFSLCFLMDSEVGRSEQGMTGLGFLLRDLADDLMEIEKEIRSNEESK